MHKRAILARNTHAWARTGYDQKRLGRVRQARYHTAECAEQCRAPLCVPQQHAEEREGGRRVRQQVQERGLVRLPVFISQPDSLPPQLSLRTACLAQARPSACADLWLGWQSKPLGLVRSGSGRHACSSGSVIGGARPRAASMRRRSSCLCTSLAPSTFLLSVSANTSGL